MSERFTEALGKQFLFWSGWVFTVGGAIGSFVLGQASAWIGWLTVLVGMLAVSSHAFALHRQMRELESANRKLSEQAAQAESRLNAVPIAVIEQLMNIVSRGVSTRIVEAITQKLLQVERLRKFLKPDSKPLNPRTFTIEAGQLYALAKVTPLEQAALLVEGDTFALVRKGSQGIGVKCARLRVHQLPERGTIVFEVFEPTGGEMTALTQLAKEREVAGITGYYIESEIDVSKYPEVDVGIVNLVISRALLELDNGIGGQE